MQRYIRIIGQVMKASLLSIVFILTAAVLGICQDTLYNRYTVGIHFDTNISGGHYTPEKLVQLAVLTGLDAVIFCDHDRMDVEYGFPPLENIVKKTISEPSLVTYGAEKYVNLMERLNTKYPELTVIHGTEAGPGYYWSGDFFSKDLTLHSWHQHMMVIGLQNPTDYENIPSTSSMVRAGYDHRIYFDIAAAAGIFLGLYMTRIRVTRTVNFSGQKMRVKKKPVKWLGILLILFCAAMLINDYPFTKRLYSPYAGNPNPEASQALIDYAVSKNALVYYAHPEGEYSGDFNGVSIHTEPYTDLLLKTRNYTGFAVFGEGWKMAGQPSGEWDQVLYQYCTGERTRPVWVVGELDFEGDLPAEFLMEVSTFVWAKENNRESILSALAKGRNYCSQIWGPNIIALDEWSVADSSGNRAISGETISTDEPVNLRFNFTVKNDKTGFEALIIRNGRQLATVSFDESMEIDFPDDTPQGKSFYRLWVLYRGTPVLAANPIFVERG